MEYEDYSLEHFQSEWPEMFSDVVCGFYLPKKWGSIVWALCIQLSKLELQIKVDQVKSKFGYLRFYVHIVQDPLSAEDLKVLHRVQKEAFSLIALAESSATAINKLIEKYESKDS